MKKNVIAIIFIILWMVTSWAQKIAVPVKVQSSLLLKILTFDRTLKTRVGKEIVIAIIYQKKFRRSLNVKEEMLKVMRETSVKELEAIPILCMSIAIDETDLASAISKRKVDILYITPVRAVGIESITAISRTKQIVTWTGVPEYVEAGIAVGIGIKGEKPQIIINLTAAKAEGADFSSELLNLAKIIK